MKAMKGSLFLSEALLEILLWRILSCLSSTEQEVQAMLTSCLQTLVWRGPEEALGESLLSRKQRHRGGKCWLGLKKTCSTFGLRRRKNNLSVAETGSGNTASPVSIVCSDGICGMIFVRRVSFLRTCGGLRVQATHDLGGK
ncbi:hypothetical protein Bbelb_337520 [Branchiostoma belcheri]|nr:hypothetical protein Bbelb_337520 [Branchiostoma belcheri]